MENINLIKGDQLEEAVQWIESLILSKIKQHPNSKVDILRKHKKKIHGVTHEIDIFVEIDHGNNYSTVFLFECKNWKSQTIGKNEIVVFSEKIRAFNASKGFFIGTKFTKDARQQAKLDPRIFLKKATEYYLSPIDRFLIELPAFRVYNGISFFEPNDRFEQGGELVQEIPKILIKDKEWSYDDFVKETMKFFIDQENIEEKFIQNPESDILTIDIKRAVEFKNNVLRLGDKVYDRVFIDFSVVIQNVRPNVCFGFDIEDRGIFLKLDATLQTGEEVVIRATAKSNQIDIGNK